MAWGQILKHRKSDVLSAELVAMTYPGRASLRPSNYYPPTSHSTRELTERTVSSTAKRDREGTEIQSASAPASLPERLGASPRGSSRGSQVSAGPRRLGTHQQRGDQADPNHFPTPVLQAPPGTASQSPPRPGPPRYLLPRYPLAAAAAAALGPAWTRSFSLPPRRVPRGRLGRRPRGEPEGAATAGPGARERRSPPVPHLGLEKGHAARFGLVLIRAVRHLGVKSLLPLHAGRKRFSLAGLGRGAGQARGRARAPTRATRPPPPPPPPPLPPSPL